MILGLRLVFMMTFALIVRISCYPMLMSNVLPSSVVPTGAGPITNAPPFFATLPADAGKRIKWGADMARDCPRAAATTLAPALHLLKEAVMLVGTLAVLWRMIRGRATYAASLLWQPLTENGTAASRTQFVGAHLRLGGAHRAPALAVAALQIEGLDTGLGRAQVPADRARTWAETATWCPDWVRAEEFSHRVPRHL